MAQLLQQDIEYVDIRSIPDRTNFYEKWVDQSSAKHSSPELVAADVLRKLYPGYSLVISDDYRLSTGSILSLPGVVVHPQEPGLEQVSSIGFTPTPARVVGKTAGFLVNNTIFGSHKLTWNNNDFLVHITHFQTGFSLKTVHFILHEGPEQPARDLLLATFLYIEQSHDEIWVFNRGGWSKSKSLWLEIKDSSWDDVVMKEENKKALQKDIYGFFQSEETYKKLSIPWKRGLIMYGPPGNGKTISIKVIMRTCAERGFAPLYVKSFQSPMGEEVSMQNVFLKTRQLAPAVLILEDLDSLINDRNRSFFLNQLDGLEGNDGLLVIGSTNHVDRLDPGLANRPSRFDRKYLFDDPSYEERVLYAKYWQTKLKSNDEISFPDSLIEEVAGLTQGFSFAYLKEAFVSTLVRITTAEGDERVDFSVVLKNQIKKLREELRDQLSVGIVQLSPTTGPEKALDERASHAKHQTHISQRNTISQRPTQLPLPTKASPPDICEELSPLPTAQDMRRRSVHGFKSRITEVSQAGTGTRVHSDTSSAERLLHAPPSAYPYQQTMPGTLPSTRPAESVQDSYRPSWRARYQHGSGVETCPKNPFSFDAPLIEIRDTVAPEPFPASPDRSTRI